jgi:4-amino-4-deoxy-L-arabinose transferase-like glycosyltransferase
MTALSTLPNASLEDPRRSPLVPRVRGAGWPTFLALLALYLAGHFALRLFGNDTLLFDESEQFVLAQTFAWGYNTQPPLMTWCFRGLAAIFGESLATLTVLRYFFLGAVYVFLYASARLMMSERRHALAAAAALLLIPSLGWEAVNDRVHTTKLCALCVATFYATLQVLHDGRTRWYVLLGVCLGLGPLCKYNYVLFALALAIAALSIREYRRRLDVRHLGLSIAIAAVIVFPHFWWLKEHYHHVVALIQAKGLTAEGGGVIGRLRGLASIAEGILFVVGPVAVVFAVCFPRALRPSARNPASPETPEVLQLLHRFLAGALVLLAGVVLIGGMAHIRLYWMLPMLTVAPLVFFARLQDSSTTRWQWRGFTAAVLAVVGIVAVARVAKARNHEDQDVLFQELAQELRTHGFHGGPVLTLGHPRQRTSACISPTPASSAPSIPRSCSPTRPAGDRICFSGTRVTSMDCRACGGRSIGSASRHSRRPCRFTT